MVLGAAVRETLARALVCAKAMISKAREGSAGRGRADVETRGLQWSSDEKVGAV